MLNVKEAVARAMDHAKDVFGMEKVADLLLEEVDRADNPDSWKITISFIRPEMVNSSFASARFMRTFKTIHLDAQTGELLRVTHRAGGIAA
ncbi:MAG: hypothetical protein IOC58_07565 [Methylobacterium sp.]|jgi:hypothetical protein|nr:hypothetical protein [Methylobacterium sp.]MCA3612726.1 hypothetical protein [Methylobacterium sp.]